MNLRRIIDIFARLFGGRGRKPAQRPARPGTAPKATAKPMRESAKRARKAAQATQRRGR